jgi:hypothetical protein
MTLTQIETELKTFIHPETGSPAFTDINTASVLLFANQKIPEAIQLLKDPIHFISLLVDAEPVDLADNAAKDAVYIDLDQLNSTFSRAVSLRVHDDDDEYVFATQLEDPEDFRRLDSSNFLTTQDDHDPVYTITGQALLVKPRSATGRSSYFSYIKRHTDLVGGSTETPFDAIGDRVFMDLVKAEYFRSVHEDEQMANVMEQRANALVNSMAKPIVAEKGQ